MDDSLLEDQEDFWIDVYNTTWLEDEDQYYSITEAQRHWSLENHSGFDLTPVPVTF